MRPAALHPLAETTALPPLQQVRVPRRFVLVADQAADARVLAEAAAALGPARPVAVTRATSDPSPSKVSCLFDI
jgi:hypothetical protein